MIAVNQDLLDLQATATELIQAYGNIYKLVRPTNKNGTIVDIVLMNQIWATFDKQVAAWVSTTGGGVIANNNKVLLVPVIKFGQIEPQAGDRFLYGNGQGWRATSVDVIRPDNVTTILYSISVS